MIPASLEQSNKPFLPSATGQGSWLQYLPLTAECPPSLLRHGFSGQDANVAFSMGAESTLAGLPAGDMDQPVVFPQVSFCHQRKILASKKRRTKIMSFPPSLTRHTPTLDSSEVQVVFFVAGVVPPSSSPHPSLSVVVIPVHAYVPYLCGIRYTYSTHSSGILKIWRFLRQPWKLMKFPPSTHI